MRDIQEVFNQIQEIKKERKEIGKEYKDALFSAAGYEETTDKVKESREKKKQIEAMTQKEMGNRYGRLEELKRETEKLNEMISDIAMTTLMDGKKVELKDQFDNEYEPVYKVTFKKIG